MLPFLNSAKSSGQKQVVAFRGINWSDQYQDGDLRNSLNLSARRYPYLTTRRSRGRLSEYSGATAMTARAGLVVVQGTDLLYDGVVVGQVTAGEKQFAVVNTKMVIWPDKVYLDLTSRTVKPLAAVMTGTGATFSADGVMTVTGWGDLTEHFNVGDGITISGCTAVAGNNKSDVTIKKITANSITVGTDVFAEGTETGTIKLERRIPDMDFICESENRLWGCSSKAQTIYASALGDPTNFFVFDSLSTDSYALAIGTEGEFTGCCKLSSSVLFWKETKLHKMLGSYPAEYSMFTYDIEGLQRGCHKSLQIINEVLYYMGLHGVYAYTGGMPSLVSAAFGDKVLTDAVAGTDGDSYYLSVAEGNNRHFLVYETNTAMWVREDSTQAVDFGRVGKNLYFLDGNGNVWVADSRAEEIGMAWMAQFAPFYETIQGRKRYTKMLLRLELPKGAWMKAEIRCDGGNWLEAGKILGQDMDSIPLQFPIRRCDCFEVRLSGSGPCTIRTMMLEYQVGSDV